MAENAPQKRLTRVEKARLEALAAFGNHDFDSMTVKKTDFHTKLKATMPKDSGSGNRRPLTRLQQARIEANKAFKGVKFGDKPIHATKRPSSKSQESTQSVTQPKVRRLDRAQKEVIQSFEGVSLGSLGKKLSRLENEQLERRQALHAEGRKPPVNRAKERRSSTAHQKRRSRRSSIAMSKQKRMTRAQRARMEALQSFGGKGLDQIAKVDKSIENSDCHGAEETTIGVQEESVRVVNSTVIGQASEGNTDKPFINISSISPIKESERILSREVSNNDSSLRQTQGHETDTEDDGFAQAPGHIGAQQETAITHARPIHRTDDSNAAIQEFDHPNTGPTTEPFKSQEICSDTNNQDDLQSRQCQDCQDAKRLTRVQKAKLEALASFAGKPLHDICKSSSRIVAKYLKPKKDQATNTQTTELCSTEAQTDRMMSKEANTGEMPLSKGPVTLTVNPADKNKGVGTQITPATLLAKRNAEFTVDSSLPDDSEEVGAIRISPATSFADGDLDVTVDMTASTKHRGAKANGNAAKVYSLLGQNSFHDHITLLETSRRVVETAMQLETPEGSPVVK
ncbi:predicted protein [Nematostella vectensis]|uniref:Uncharacterized protein n=1 Tax=Nematostella vectensis TaxID=45351 RepID=A7RW75_NEMVE|nr:uncharacterized protein LOC5516173 [Nematostella vectensis]EDO44261.1 predicted protein [Nematostella vectensis]|eukprot:XP_001636324.1 predicted protein [Nematostella vectensis]